MMLYSEIQDNTEQGVYQNKLESNANKKQHNFQKTFNSPSLSTRDMDMAEGMMVHNRNEHLSRAATDMLAQANRSANCSQFRKIIAVLVEAGLLGPVSLSLQKISSRLNKVLLSLIIAS
jgi:hypothetical protein